MSHTKITIKLTERELELTSEEAKELRGKLNELLEPKKSEMELLKNQFSQKEYVPAPYPVYIYPPQPYYPPYSPYPYIYCSTVTQATSQNFC